MPLASRWMVVSIVKVGKRTPWSVIALDEKLIVHCPAVPLGKFHLEWGNMDNEVKERC